MRYWGFMLWFFQDSCRFSDVHVGWSPIHWILDQSIGGFCYGRLHTHTLWAPLHKIINFNDGPASQVVAQCWTNNAFLIWTVEVFQMLHFAIKIAIPFKYKTSTQCRPMCFRPNVGLASQRVIQHVLSLQQRDMSMCVLGTLETIPFDKQIYIYLFKSVKDKWGLLLISENLESEN